jgi:hypothetical protein
MRPTYRGTLRMLARNPKRALVPSDAPPSEINQRKGILQRPNLQRFVVPRDAFYLLHHVFDGLEKVRTLDVELVLGRFGLIVVLLGNCPDHDETVSRPLLVICRERASIGDDLGSSVLVLPASPSCVIVIDALWEEKMRN